MRDIGPAPTWSTSFKRQIVVIGMIAISPMMGFLAHASDVPRALLAALYAAGVVALGVGVWYLYGRSRPPAEDRMSAQERWICTIALTAVVTLLAFNVYKMYS